MSRIDKLQKYLGEADFDIQDFEGHINGAKGWLDDIKTQAQHGNIKGAKKGYENLMKNLKLLKKFF